MQASNIAEVYVWVLSGACAILLTMVAFFLVGMYRQFMKLVDTVRHIERVVELHAGALRSLMGLPPELGDAP